MIIERSTGCFKGAEKGTFYILSDIKIIHGKIYAWTFPLLDYELLVYASFSHLPQLLA